MSNHGARTWDHKGSKPLGPKLLPLGHHLDDLSPTIFIIKCGCCYFLKYFSLKKHQNIIIFYVLKIIFNISVMVVKLASWLVKSYDFTSQLRYIVWNRVENSKIRKLGQTQLKSVKLGKLGPSLPSLTKLSKTMESSHCSQSSPLHPVSLTKIPPFPFPFPQINPSRSRSHILLFSNLKPSRSQRLPLSFSQNPHFFSLFRLPLIWLSPPLRSPVSSLHSSALFAGFFH